MPGYIGHQLQRCIEVSNRYILLVNWESLEAHTIGFRGSAEYQDWKRLLHHFYDPFPTVEHYELALSLRSDIVRVLRRLVLAGVVALFIRPQAANGDSGPPGNGATRAWRSVLSERMATASRRAQAYPSRTIPPVAAR